MSEFITLYLSKEAVAEGKHGQKFKHTSDIASLTNSVKDFERSLDYTTTGFELLAIDLGKRDELLQLLSILTKERGVEIKVNALEDEHNQEIHVILSGEEADEDKNFVMATIAYTLVHSDIWNNYPRVQFG